MFAVLGTDSSSSSEEEDSNNRAVQPQAAVDIPSYEDLSAGRIDEETVLRAVYGDDFQPLKGVWGCPNWQVIVRPVESSETNRQLKLQVQLTKQYPYVAPTIKVLDETKSLSSQKEVNELVEALKKRGAELALSGSVMMLEFVQLAEDFLMEHRYDPNMSAWEQMKARELAQQQEERAAHEEMARLMDKPTEASSTGNPLSPSVSRRSDDVAMIEKEMERQREAIEAARRDLLRKDTGDMLLEEVREEEGDDEELDDDFFDFDDDEGMMLDTKSTSRYLADFVEMGVLGRGGGGEVVKAKNRLDRRVYAVKKILLEPEQGTNAKARAGAIQNKKLRREVTTISRMTHKNIVRYYQAWVESDQGTGKTDPITEEDGEQSSKDFIPQNSSDSDGDSDGNGFWTNSPMDDTLATRILAQARGSSDDESSFSDESNDMESSSPPGKPGWADRRHTESIIDLLEHENEAFQSPLMAGLGFQDPMYKSMYKERSMDDIGDDEDDSSEPWDESSVKIGDADGRAILYIQMEYCATTLRKLIDDGSAGKMAENDIWRLVRQVLEALSYLHSRNVIHRDLKPGNIFLDSEDNVKLGDFGLATRNRDLGEAPGYDASDLLVEGPANPIYDTIEDIRPLLGEPVLTDSRVSVEASTGQESMTGGVGTTYYRAPEQEGRSASAFVAKGEKGESSYTVQADLFSLGIILFEMFHPPFATYMERAETLTILRGDKSHFHGRERTDSSEEREVRNENYQQQAKKRFPDSFIATVPNNAQE